MTRSLHNAGLLSNMELKQGLPHHRDLGISAVVEHSNTKSEGQGLGSHAGLRSFFRSQVRSKANKIFLFFFFDE